MDYEKKIRELETAYCSTQKCMIENYEMAERADNLHTRRTFLNAAAFCARQLNEFAIARNSIIEKQASIGQKLSLIEYIQKKEDA